MINQNSDKGFSLEDLNLQSYSVAAKLHGLIFSICQILSVILFCNGDIIFIPRMM